MHRLDHPRPQGTPDFPTGFNTLDGVCGQGVRAERSCGPLRTQVVRGFSPRNFQEDPTSTPSGHARPPATHHGRNPPYPGRSVVSLTGTGIDPSQDREGYKTRDSVRTTALLPCLPKKGGRIPKYPCKTWKTILQSGDSSVGRAQVSQT